VGADVNVVSDYDGIHKNEQIDAGLGSHLDKRTIKAILH
jgi:hypothetical protein